MREALRFVPDHDPEDIIESTAEVINLQLVETLISQYKEDEAGTGGKSMSKKEITAHRAYLHTLVNDSSPETRAAVNRFLKEVENN